MPLFMDLHKAGDYAVKPTIEEIKHNHIADLKTQAKYGVRFIQYWINEEAGLVFCLMEAPDKESCIATHRAAHGNMACNIIELKGGDYQTFMGDGRPNEFDIAEHMEGVLDPGNRSIVVAELFARANDAYPFIQLKETAKKMGGREVSFKGRRMRFVFNNAFDALKCAQAFRSALADRMENHFEIRIGISSGAPVTERDSIFADAIQLGDWICDICKNGKIIICSQTSTVTLSASEGSTSNIERLKPADEKFIRSIMPVLSSALSGGTFSIETLGMEVGISQAQLYRKIVGLTGYSPNAFVQELKLRNSLRLLHQEFGNVAQIAFESGFNSPSYFTKSFRKRFGTSPLDQLKGR